MRRVVRLARGGPVYRRTIGARRGQFYPGSPAANEQTAALDLACGTGYLPLFLHQM